MYTIRYNKTKQLTKWNGEDAIPGPIGLQLNRQKGTVLNLTIQHTGLPRELAARLITFTQIGFLA